jgi:hypothetical protein
MLSLFRPSVAISVNNFHPTRPSHGDKNRGSNSPLWQQQCSRYGVSLTGDRKRSSVRDTLRTQQRSHLPCGTSWYVCYPAAIFAQVSVASLIALLTSHTLSNGGLTPPPTNNTHKLSIETFVLYISGIEPFFVRVPSDVIYLQFCTPRVVGVWFKWLRYYVTSGFETRWGGLLSL